MKILIQNGHVLDPVTSRNGVYDVLVEDDKIVKVEKGITAEADKVIDAEGCYVMPGFVDLHVHFRDPGAEYKEDIFTGAKAAAAGGFTSVVLMANTTPHVDNEETLSYVTEKGKKTGIHVYTCANVTMDMAGDELTDMETLAKAGAVGFTDDASPFWTRGLARKAMQEAARLHMPISFHEENPAFIVNNGINAGAVSQKLGLGGSDRQAEIDMVRPRPFHRAGNGG